MSEWEDITISRHDKDSSQDLLPEDIELSRQVFVLSDIPPTHWTDVFCAAMVGSPGRLGREAQIDGQDLMIWGGPKIFDERDARHLKKLVAYANEKYREMLQPADLSGFDAFGVS